MAAGQSSKDVWILSDGPVEPVTLLASSVKLVELRRSTADLTSRVADNLFWLGRNAERAEAMVRHLRSCIVRLTNDLEPSGLNEVVELVAAFSDVDPAELPPPDTARNAQLLEELRQEVISWLFDCHGGRAHWRTRWKHCGIRRRRCAIDYRSTAGES